VDGWDDMLGLGFHGLVPGTLALPWLATVGMGDVAQQSLKGLTVQAQLGYGISKLILKVFASIRIAICSKPQRLLSSNWVYSLTCVLL